MERAFERYSDIIPVFDTFQERLNSPLPQHLRVNTLKIKTEQLLQALERKGILLKDASPAEEPLFLAPKARRRESGSNTPSATSTPRP
jgi:16S rRNA C967 or C1407 C5-methylase (RsmB/RsmF family)